MVHGQDRVEDVVRVGEAHAEQAVAGEQVAGVLDDGSLQGDFINHADITRVLRYCEAQASVRQGSAKDGS